jgi:hypothetical protein
MISQIITITMESPIPINKHQICKRLFTVRLCSNWRKVKAMYWMNAQSSAHSAGAQRYYARAHTFSSRWVDVNVMCAALLFVSIFRSVPLIHTESLNHVVVCRLVLWVVRKQLEGSRTIVQFARLVVSLFETEHTVCGPESPLSAHNPLI